MDRNSWPSAVETRGDHADHRARCALGACGYRSRD